MKIAMVRVGVCLSTGTVLDKKELVANAISSFIHAKANGYRERVDSFGPGQFRVTVIYGAGAINLKKSVKAAAHNTDSIEKNFHAKMVYDGMGGEPSYSVVNPNIPITVVDIV